MFYFDFVALFGQHLVADELVAHIGDVVLHTKPGYRFWDPTERYSAGAGVPISPDKIVTLSRSIERFQRNSIRDEDLIRIELMFRGWTDGTFSASRAIIEDQMSFALCPNLVGIFTSLRWNPGREDQLRVGITLIDFCHQRIPRLELAEARYALAVIMYGTDEGVISPPPEFDVRFLEDESVPWGLGLGLYFGDSFGILRLPTVILLEDFIAHEYPYGVGSEEFSLERLGASAQAFGRLVGLCIVHDSDVSYLRLPLGVVKMLHPRFRMLVKTKADFIAQLGSTSLDAFAEFSGGVYDALNPGGFYMFSPDKWLSLFTYIPDAPLAL
jgi:hypothetical protein